MTTERTTTASIIIPDLPLKRDLRRETSRFDMTRMFFMANSKLYFYTSENPVYSATGRLLLESFINVTYISSSADCCIEISTSAQPLLAIFSSTDAI